MAALTAASAAPHVGTGVTPASEEREAPKRKR